MGYLKLEPKYQYQIRDMFKKQGKPAEEVIEYFKSSYNIKLTAAQVSRYANKTDDEIEGSKPLAEDPAEPQQRAGRKVRKAKQRKPDKTIQLQDGELDSLVLEIRERMRHTREGFMQVFKALRAEAIKAQAEVQRMKKGLSLPMLPAEIEVTPADLEQAQEADT